MTESELNERFESIENNVNNLKNQSFTYKLILLHLLRKTYPNISELQLNQELANLCAIIQHNLQGKNTKWVALTTQICRSFFEVFNKKYTNDVKEQKEK